MDIRLAKTVSELMLHETAWTELAANASDANPFFESWMLVPAMAHLLADDVQVAFVYDGEKLCGVFPLRRHYSVSSLSLKAAVTWRHEHAALAQPVLRCGAEVEVVRTFVAWWEAAHDERFLGFDFLARDSVVAGAIVAVLQESGRSVFELDAFSRAAFRPARSVEEYLKQGLPRHRRKEFSRLRKRWEELGELRFVVFDAQHLTSAERPEVQLEQWLQQFIQLEQEGWKGEAGSALARRAAEQNYFLDICRNAYRRRALLLMHLEFEGKPVAMKCDIISGSSVFTYKIAYAEQFSKYSPGVLLEIDHMRYFENRPEFSLLDSCAVAQHPMIDRIWQERRSIVSLLTHRKGAVLQFIVGGVLPGIRRLRHLVNGSGRE